MKKWHAIITLGAFAIVSLTATPAHAYLDASTASMMLQGLLGAVAGGLVAGRLYWAKIKALYSKYFSSVDS